MNQALYTDMNNKRKMKKKRYKLKVKKKKNEYEPLLLMEIQLGSSKSVVIFTLTDQYINLFCVYFYGNHLKE
jgi:hypothetical protein